MTDEEFFAALRRCFTLDEEEYPEDPGEIVPVLVIDKPAAMVLIEQFRADARDCALDEAP